MIPHPTSGSTTGILPKLALSVELGAPLDSLLAEGGEAVRREVGRRCAAVCETLGVPVEPVVELRAGTSRVRPLRLRVHGHSCQYPDDLPLTVFSYLTGQPLQQSTPADFAEWSEHAVRGNGYREEIAEWIGSVSAEILKHRPGSIVNEEVTNAYRDRLPLSSQNIQRLPILQTPALKKLLATIVDLWVSVKDGAAVARVLGSEGDPQRADEEMCELILNELRPRELALQLSPGYLELMTQERDRWLFSDLRYRLYYESGIPVPSVQIEVAADLRPFSFRFSVNHLTTPARAGLRENTLLTAARALDGKGVLNPANGQAYRLTAGTGNPGRSPEDQSWTPLGYIVLALAADLRLKAACLVDLAHTDQQLDTLGTAFGSLVEAARGKFSLAQLTRLLRRLAAEGIGIRDLRGILDAALDYDIIKVDPRLTVFDHRLPWPTTPTSHVRQDIENFATFVRTMLKRYVSHATLRGRDTLRVYLLPAEVEQELEREFAGRTTGANSPPATAMALQDALVAAIRRETPETSLLAPLDPILTTVTARSLVRDLIADEFPRLPVVAYQELASDIRIEPIAQLQIDPVSQSTAAARSFNRAQPSANRD